MSSLFKSIGVLVIIVLVFLIYNLYSGRDTVCSEYAGRYRDDCYMNTAMEKAEKNPEEGWEICSRMRDEEEMNHCYSNVGVVASKTNTTYADSICARIPDRRWRGECFFKNALQATYNNQSNSIYLCDKAEVFRVFCYHDVAGEISLVSPDEILGICGSISNTLTARACYHGVGKYLGRVNGSLAKAVCSSNVVARKDECFHGLGWGVSETINHSVSLDVCDTLKLPLMYDCIVGCAWEVARTDMEKALFICDKIKNDTLKEKCLTFPA